MNTQNVNRNSQDLETIKQLYFESFPKDEQMSFEELLDLSQKKEYEFLAFYEESNFIGFVYINILDPVIYGFYLAIVPSLRNQGYGGRVIEYLQEIYPNHQIIADIEWLDPNSKNYQQRKRRKEFYLSHGFQSTNYSISGRGVRYEILCTKSDFRSDIYLELLNRLKIPNFHPVLVPIQKET